VDVTEEMEINGVLGLGPIPLPVQIGIWTLLQRVAVARSFQGLEPRAVRYSEAHTPRSEKRRPFWKGSTATIKRERKRKKRKEKGSD
jgi:hypothetical protein